MAHYTDEQIKQAQKTDMVSFISQRYNTSFIRQGSYFRCKAENMSSLIIKSDRARWYWNSHNLSGASAIDWLIGVDNYSFQQAVSELLGKSYTDSIIIEEQKAEKKQSSFDGGVPRKHYDRQYKTAFDYLQIKRCISSSVIDELMKQGKIYQDTKYNVVFANLDAEQNIKYWCLRGTNPNKKFSMNMQGTGNPYYGFEVDSVKPSDTLYVFEAPIDLLSHCTIADIKYGKGSWKSTNRLALCGVGDWGLDSYLKRHENIKTIKFCLDNDTAGKNATEKLCEKYYNLGYKVQTMRYKDGAGKDLNEILCTHLKKISEKTSSLHSSLNSRNNIDQSSKQPESKNAFEGKI